MTNQAQERIEFYERVLRAQQRRLEACLEDEDVTLADVEELLREVHHALADVES